MTFEVVYNTALKIYSKLYVGVKTQGTDKAPLAFATPYTEDAAGRKRQDTVKNWVGTSTYDYETRKHVSFEPDLRVIDNVAMAGFKITDDIKRVYYGGGNVVWRLEHPLGWEIEIQSNNLMALIQGVGIEAGGVVSGECVLARDGAHNVLLPVSSQEYKDAVKAFEAVKSPSKIPMKDRVLGRMYRLQDGSFGQYFGKFFVTEIVNGYEKNGYADAVLVDIPNVGVSSVQGQLRIVQILNGRQEVFEAVFSEGGGVKLFKTAPLISELDQGSMPEDGIIDVVRTSKYTFAGARSSNPVMLTRKKPGTVVLDFNPVSDEMFEERFNDMIRQEELKLDMYAHQLKQGYWDHLSDDSKPGQPKLSIQSMFSWKYICLKGDDQVYAYSNTLYNQLAPSRDGFDVIGVLQKQKPGSSIYRYATTVNHNAAIQRGALMDPLTHLGTIKVLPKFNTIDEIKEHVNALRSSGALVQETFKEV
jgi:hypothetical protein